MTSAPLAGVRVLDLTRLLPGGYATLILASLGAEVTKLEQPPLGDGIRQMLQYPGQSDSAGHAVLNRGKASVSIDLKTPEGQQLARQIVAEYDVLIDSFRPGVLDRLGLSAAALAEVNPTLVHVSITAFGYHNELVAEPAHDLNSVGYAGLLSFVGDELPVMPGLQVADLSSGLHAALAVLAGLRVRDVHGIGYRGDVSMAESAAAMAPLQAATLLGTSQDPPIPDMLTGALACYQIYRCADGRAITVGGLEPKFFARMCELIGRPQLADLQYDPQRQDELRDALADLFATQAASYWLGMLAGADACVGPVATLSEALANPVFVERGATETVGMSGGERGTVFRVTPWDPRPQSDEATMAPSLGVDTRRVLADIGVSEAQLAALMAAGVVASPD